MDKTESENLRTAVLLLTAYGAMESPNCARGGADRFKLLKKRWLASSRRKSFAIQNSKNSKCASLALVEGLADCLPISSLRCEGLMQRMESLVCYSKEKGIGYRLESGMAG